MLCVVDGLYIGLQSNAYSLLYICITSGKVRTSYLSRGERAGHWDNYHAQLFITLYLKITNFWIKSCDKEKMSNLAKDDDILRMIDDCGEQSMLTVCSLIFLVLYTLRVQNFARRKANFGLIHESLYTRKKPEIYDSGKLIHAKKN